MKVIFLCLFLLLSNNLYAEDRNSFVGPPENVRVISAIEINEIFDLNYSEETPLIDLVEKEEKISICYQTYTEKQSKSYAKIAQENLYDLIHNFGKIVLKIQGKKPEQDTTTHDEKISALAKVQCETYYKMGILK